MDALLAEARSEAAESRRELEHERQVTFLAPPMYMLGASRIDI
eukprot:COSAG05_NODE_610_length_8361_cov_211.582789_2_plen_43_part_00